MISFSTASRRTGAAFISLRIPAARAAFSAFRPTVLAARAAACLLCMAVLFSLSGHNFAMAAEAARAQAPLEALALAQRGIDQSEPDLFYQAVDVNSVLARGADAGIAAIKEQMAKGTLGELNPMLALAVAGMDTGDAAKTKMLKQLLTSEVRTFVAAGIRGGYFAGKPNGKVDAGSFSPLLDGLSKGRKEIVAGKVLSHKGDTAKVSATFIDHGAGTFPLELGLEQRNGQWQVVEISNAAALIQEAAKGGK